MLGWPVTQAAKNCRVEQASRTEFIYSPREERGQMYREMSALNLAEPFKGFEGYERVVAVPVVEAGVGGKGVDSWPGRAGGGRFLEGLCPGLVQDVSVVRLQKNMFCGWDLLSENGGHHNLERQGQVQTPVSVVHKLG